MQAWLKRWSVCLQCGDLCSIPGLGRSPGEGNVNPLQDSCLEHPIDRGAWCRILSMGSQRVGHDWATSLSFFKAPKTFSWFSLGVCLILTPLSFTLLPDCQPFLSSFPQIHQVFHQLMSFALIVLDMLSFQIKVQLYLLCYFIQGSTQESYYEEYFPDLLFKMAASTSSRPLPYLTSLLIIYHFLIYFFFIVGVLIRM